MQANPRASMMFVLCMLIHSPHVRGLRWEVQEAKKQCDKNGQQQDIEENKQQQDIEAKLTEDQDTINRNLMKELQSMREELRAHKHILEAQEVQLGIYKQDIYKQDSVDRRNQVAMLQIQEGQIPEGCQAWEQLCPGGDITRSAWNPTSTFHPGNHQGCLREIRHPTHFFFRIQAGVGGTINFRVSADFDIDYALYGPYDDFQHMQTSCGSFPYPISCSYSSRAIEDVQVQHFIGEKVYALLVSNFANLNQNFTISELPGGTTSIDCATIPTPAPVPAPATAHGDPHGSNIRGEQFDINRDGSHTLLTMD